MQWLKQSTAATVKIGPFVDETDGVTPEDALTIAQADIRLSKNGGAFAATNDETGATHDENGYYGVPLDTTDTATLGTLRVAVNESGALPVFADFMVVPAAAYDSLVLGSDTLPADVTQWNGTNVASPSVNGVPKVDIQYGNGVTIYPVLQSGTDSTTLVLTSDESDVDGHLVGQLIDISETGVARVMAYTGSTRTATVVNVRSGSPFSPAPTSGQSYRILDLKVLAPLTHDGALIPEVETLGETALAALNAEVDTALSDIHLDYVFATAYDPTSKPGDAAGLLNVLMENDGGVPRYTANALEQIAATSVDVGSIGGRTVSPVTQAGGNGTTTLVLAATEPPGTEAWVGRRIHFPASGEIGIVSAYDGSTKTVTFDPVLDVTLSTAGGLEYEDYGSTASGLTAADVWTYGTRVLTDKVGFKLASDGLDSVVAESGVNFRQAQSVIFAAAAGLVAGAETTSMTISAAGSGNSGTGRIAATVDADGNRSAVTLTLPT